MLPPSARELWPFFVRAEPRRRRRIARRRRRRHDRTLIICLQSELLTFISYLLARAAGFLPALGSVVWPARAS
jgi:hypothetical protein